MIKLNNVYLYKHKKKIESYEIDVKLLYNIILLIFLEFNLLIN
jgi:hypothetical protein